MLCYVMLCYVMLWKVFRRMLRKVFRNIKFKHLMWWCIPKAKLVFAVPRVFFYTRTKLLVPSYNVDSWFCPLIWNFIWNWNWHWHWNALRESQKLWQSLCVLRFRFRGGYAPWKRTVRNTQAPSQSFWDSLKSFQLQCQFQFQLKFQIHFFPPTFRVIVE